MKRFIIILMVLLLLLIVGCRNVEEQPMPIIEEIETEVIQLEGDINGLSMQSMFERRVYKDF